MRKKIKELKKIARGNLSGHYMNIIQAAVFCSVIISLLEMPFSMLTNEDDFSTQNLIYYIAVFLIGIISVVLTAGQYRIHMTLARTGEVHLKELFVPIKSHADRYIITELILFGLSLVCVIPIFGAVAIIYLYNNWAFYLVAVLLCLISAVLLTMLSLTFDLVYYVLNDNDHFTALDAMKYTMNMVKTHKGRYFYMQLSFIGMQFLSLLSLGIASLWVAPYMMQTTTLFYLDINNELDSILEKRSQATPTQKSTAFDQYV